MRRRRRRQEAGPAAIDDDGGQPQSDGLPNADKELFGVQGVPPLPGEEGHGDELGALLQQVGLLDGLLGVPDPLEYLVSLWGP